MKAAGLMVEEWSKQQPRRNKDPDSTPVNTLLSHLTQSLLPKIPRQGKHITEERGEGREGTEKTRETGTGQTY